MDVLHVLELCRQRSRDSQYIFAGPDSEVGRRKLAMSQNELQGGIEDGKRATGGSSTYVGCGWPETLSIAQV